MSTGTPHAVLATSWTGGRLACQLYFDSPDADLNTERYAAMESNRDAFDTALGEPAVWDPMPGRKGARISLFSDCTDVGATDDCALMIEWLMGAQLRFRSAWGAVDLFVNERPR